MAIEEDLKTIETLQNKFKQDHGVYFSMDWALPVSGGQKIDIPLDTDILSLTEIKRYIGKGLAYPTIEKLTVDFIPTDKSYRFLVGRGTQIGFDTNGIPTAMEKDYWYCKAIHVDKDGLYTERTIEGGDLSLSIFKGN